MYLIRISKKNKIIFSIVLGILMAVGYYLAVYQSFRYQSENQTIGGVMLLSGICFLTMIWFRWRKFWSMFAMIFVSILLIFLILQHKKYYIADELKKNGVQVKAKVIGFEEKKSRRSTTPFATFEYEFQNKKYRQRIENYDDEYKQNQILNLKISSEKPEIFEILE